MAISDKSESVPSVVRYRLVLLVLVGLITGANAHAQQPLAEVSIAAVYSKAMAQLANPEFRVTRSPVAASALTVNLSITQDESYLTDTSPTVTIAANEASAVVALASSARTAAGGDLTATVAAGTGYVPAASPADTATVQMVQTSTALTYRWAESAYTVIEGDSVAVGVSLRTASGAPKPRAEFLMSISTAEDSAQSIEDYPPVSVNLIASPAEWMADGDVFAATVTYDVETQEDTDYEGSEEFTIELEMAAGTPLGPTCDAAEMNGTDCITRITITDDDKLGVTAVAVSSSPATGDTYGAGETVSFTVTFNAEVAVTGTPLLGFTLGSPTKQAEYRSGSESEELVFAYTVATGDNDTDGISWPADSLALSGGTIRFATAEASEAVDADLSHAAAGAQSGHKVDTLPVLDGATVTGSVLTLTFNEPLNDASVPAGSAFTVKGAGTPLALADSNPVAVAGSMVTLTLAAPVSESQTEVTVSYAAPASNPIEDAGGGDAAAFTDQAVSNLTSNAAPTAQNSTVTVSEDAVHPFAASEFGFSDTDPGDALASVKVVVPPVVGSLLHNSDVVEADDVVSKSDLDGGRLTFRPEANANGTGYTGFTFRVSDGRVESASYTMTIDVTPVNDPAAGAPTVAGDATVGGTLTADPAGITDPDGVPATLTWQWLRVGADGVSDEQAIDEATAAAYTLTADDRGKRIRVRAAFTDDDGTAEQVTSEAFPLAGTVTDPPAVPGPVHNLRATAGDRMVSVQWEPPEREGTTAVRRYEVRYAAGATVPVDTEWQSVALKQVFQTAGLKNGTGYAFEVRAVNDTGPGPASQVRATPEQPETPETPVSGAGADLSLFTSGTAVEGRSISVGVRRSGGLPRPDQGVEVVVAILDSARPQPEAKVIRIAPGAREGEVEMVLPFDGEHSDEREFVVELSAGTWKPAGPYSLGRPSRVALPVSDAEARLSVSDPAVREGTNAFLRFRVSMDRTRDTAVMVDYATSDGTARAGEDYTPASGTITFAPGETVETVAVTVLADAHDEQSETLILRLLHPRGAVLADAVATGTILNTTAMPREWLGWYGSTVADQVLDAIESRMRIARQSGVRIAVAGNPIDPAGAGAAELAPWMPAGGPGTEAPAVTARGLVTGSAFALSTETQAQEQISLWGRGAGSIFDGRDGALSVSGEVMSGILGVDIKGERWSAGLLVPHSRSHGSYGGARTGQVEAVLTGVFPWVRYAFSDQVESWVAGGYGAGELTVRPIIPGTGKLGASMRADLGLWMAATGLRGVLLNGGDHGPTLAARSDALVVHTASGRAHGADGSALEPAQAMVTRLRLGLEFSQTTWLAGDAVLSPRLEIGVRHDGGDARTGFGIDLGGGLELSDARSGFALEVNGRGVLTPHHGWGFRERGFSGSLSWNQQPGSDRGARMTLTQSVGGDSTDSANAPFVRRTTDALGTLDNAADDLAKSRFALEFGYGIPAFDDRYTFTPEAGVSLTDAGREYRVGWRLSETARRRGTTLDLFVAGLRREETNADTPPRHALDVGFKAQL